MTELAAKETIYTKEFRESLEASTQPEWLKALRREAFGYFTENGFPTVQNEEWKYTNIAPVARESFEIASESKGGNSSVSAGANLVAEESALAAARTSAFVFAESRDSVLVFTNGSFDKNLSSFSALNGATVLSFAEAASDEKYSEIFKARLGSLIDYDKNGFTALNTAFIGEGAFVFIPKNARIEAPIQLLFLTDEGSAAFPRVLVVAESFSEATLIETYVRAAETKYLTDAVVEISVADEAKLKHYRVQRESRNAFHVGASGTEVHRGSVYDATNITLGAHLSRHDVAVKFQTEGGEAFVDGLYMVGGEQHADTHSVIDHQLPNCVSHQTYKGIVDGKARAVFNGKVFVRENASGTDAQQSNKNLLLSNDARVDTKPQLEIFNDDVKCSHGATVGQLEEEELFYLLSRGLNESLARNLLTYGFAEEIVNKIGIESIKKQLDQAILNRLNANLEA